MRTWPLVLLLCLFSAPVFSESGLPQHSCKIISQQIGSEERGNAIMPIGGNIYTVPLRRNSDIIVIETEGKRLTLAEQGRKFVILTEGSSAAYFVDGPWYVFLDVNHKKHKFGLLHAEKIQ